MIDDMTARHVGVDVLEEALDLLVPEILALCGAPGMSLAVGVDGEVVLAKGYGQADLAAARPMTPTTVGPTGSDCKPYTATAAMQLVERGLIDLDAPVNEYLGDLRLVNPHGARDITLRDLLTHRSGLGSDMGYCGMEPPPPLGELIRTVLADGRTDAYGGSLLPLWATEVGINYQYSNLGIAIVGYLVELLNPDRSSFSEWVRDHVFQPLAMTSTCFPIAQDAAFVPADILARRSAGYATLPGLRFRLPPIYVGAYPAGSALTPPRSTSGTSATRAAQNDLATWRVGCCSTSSRPGPTETIPGQHAAPRRAAPRGLAATWPGSWWATGSPRGSASRQRRQTPASPRSRRPPTSPPASPGTAARSPTRSWTWPRQARPCRGCSISPAGAFPAISSRCWPAS